MCAGYCEAASSCMLLRDCSGPHTSQDIGVKTHYLPERLLSAKEKQTALHVLWSEDLQKGSKTDDG